MRPSSSQGSWSKGDAASAAASIASAVAEVAYVCMFVSLNMPLLALIPLLAQRPATLAEGVEHHERSPLSTYAPAPNVWHVLVTESPKFCYEWGLASAHFCMRRE